MEYCSESQTVINKGESQQHPTPNPYQMKKGTGERSFLVGLGRMEVQTVRDGHWKTGPDRDERPAIPQVGGGGAAG